MRVELKLFIVSMLFIVTGCNSTEAEAMDFCPTEIEQEARETLGLVGKESLSLHELLALAGSKSLVYEPYEIDNKPLNCSNIKLDSDYLSYMVYAGFNETKEYKKAYLVIANSMDSKVLYIDKRYMYKAPKMF